MYVEIYDVKRGSVKKVRRVMGKYGGLNINHSTGTMIVRTSEFDEWYEDIQKLVEDGDVSGASWTDYNPR